MPTKTKIQGQTFLFTGTLTEFPRTVKIITEKDFLKIVLPVNVISK